MKPIKTALIGYGYWGKKVFSYLKTNPGLELAAVYFRGLEKLAEGERAALYGTEFTPRLNEILDNPEIRALVIVTPVGTHYALTKSALEHGKHVLVEKPMSVRAREAIELGELARSRNLKLMTEYVYTFSKALRAAKELVQSGKIGRIESLSVSFKQLGRFLDCDVMTLLGSHGLSILNEFISIEECEFQVKPMQRTNGLVTACSIYFESRSGVRGHLELSTHAPVREKKLVIFGEKGTMTYDPMSSHALKCHLYSRDLHKTGSELILEESKWKFDEDQNLGLAVESFLRVLRDGHDDNLKSSISISKVLESLTESRE